MGSAQSLFVSTFTVDETQVQTNYFYKLYYNAVSKLSKERVSLFLYQVNNNQDVAQFLSAGLTTLKKLRHPGLIKYNTSQQDQDGITLVTSQVTPLKEFKVRLSEDDVCMGLYSLLEVALFLQKAGFTHVLLSEATIFVNPEDFKWKLGNAEFIVANADVPGQIEKISELLTKQKISLHEAVISENMAESFYAFVLRTVIPLVRSMRSTSLPWDQLEDGIAKHQSLSEMHSLPFFKTNALINMVRSLIDYRLSAPNVKVELFRKLAEELHSISPDSVEKFILPLLLDLDFFAEFGCAPVYESLASFPALTKSLIPFMESALRSRRLEVRVNFLKVLHCFVPLVKSPFLHHELIPEVLAGIEEEDDELYFYSLQAISILIPFSIESFAFFSNSPEGKIKPIVGPIRLTDTVITHVVKNCVAGLQFWDFMDILTSLWRTVITIAIVQKSKSSDLPAIFRQLAKTHHTLLQSMNADQKVELFNNRLVSKRLLLSEDTVDGNTSWISRAIELVTPYLRDENQMVRKAAAASITKWISLIDELYEGIPSISKSSRNAENTLNKLKEIYPLTIRVRNFFGRSIQRRSSRLSPDGDLEQVSSMTSTPKTPYIDRNTLNAQRQASYMQSKNKDEPFHITELPVTIEEELNTTNELKERSRRPTEEDIDVDVSGLKI